MRKEKSEDADPGTLSLEWTLQVLSITTALVTFHREDMSAFPAALAGCVPEAGALCPGHHHILGSPCHSGGRGCAPLLPKPALQASRAPSSSPLRNCMRLPSEKEGVPALRAGAPSSSRLYPDDTHKSRPAFHPG